MLLSTAYKHKERKNEKERGEKEGGRMNCLMSNKAAHRASSSHSDINRQRVPRRLFLPPATPNPKKDEIGKYPLLESD